MELINKTFLDCPNCGSTSRFLQTLGDKVRERGITRPEWSMFFDVREGVVSDQTRDAMIPIGSEMPTFLIYTDICLDCGTIYAVHIEEGTAKKGVRPQQIPPGPLSPGTNDPRFS